MHTRNLDENRKSTNSVHNKLIVKTCGNNHIIEVNNVISWETDSTYPYVASSADVKIHISKTHGIYENMLTECGLNRLHKSYLINMLKIMQFHSHDGRHIIMANGQGSQAASRECGELFLFFEKPVE